MKNTIELRRKVKNLNVIAKLIALPIVTLMYIAYPFSYLYGMGKAVFDLTKGKI